jgi:hypothetical protein
MGSIVISLTSYNAPWTSRDSDCNEPSSAYFCAVRLTITDPGVTASVPKPAHATRNPPSEAGATETCRTRSGSVLIVIGAPIRLPAESVRCAITTLLRVVEPAATHTATLPPPASRATAPAKGRGLLPTSTGSNALNAATAGGVPGAAPGVPPFGFALEPLGVVLESPDPMANGAPAALVGAELSPPPPPPHAVRNDANSAVSASVREDCISSFLVFSDRRILRHRAPTKLLKM